MGIRKADLRDFIQDKSRKRKSEIREAARAAIEVEIRRIVFEKFKDVDSIERQAQQFHDALLKMKEAHSRFSNWYSLNRIISDINNDIIGLRMDIVRRETSCVLSNLLERGTNGVMKEVDEIVPQFKDKLAKMIAEFRDLVKVSEEISAIIDSCNNGDKAYKRLEELGVDLTEFKLSSQNLPAIVALSANVCVLNGDC